MQLNSNALNVIFGLGSEFKNATGNSSEKKIKQNKTKQKQRFSREYFVATTICLNIIQ